MRNTDIERTIERVVARATGTVNATFPEGADVLDPNQLATSMEVIKKRLEGVFESPRTSRLLRFAGGVLKRIVMSDGFRELALRNRDTNLREDEERIRALPLGPELLDLLLSADSRVRHGGLIAYFDLWPFDLREPPNLAPLSGLNDIDRLDGERRAVAVVRAFIPVCESMYLRVARGVRKLELFADGKVTAGDLSLGNILAAARHRDGHAARILDLDAAWIRNAAAHSHFAYVPADHAVELWNKGSDRKRYPVHVLEERLSTIAEFALTTANRVMLHYVQISVLKRGGFDEAILDLLPAILGGDEAFRRERGDHFVRRLEKEFGPLIQAVEADEATTARQ